MPLNLTLAVSLLAGYPSYDPLHVLRGSHGADVLLPVYEEGGSTLNPYLKAEAEVLLYDLLSLSGLHALLYLPHRLLVKAGYPRPVKGLPGGVLLYDADHLGNVLLRGAGEDLGLLLGVGVDGPEGEPAQVQGDVRAALGELKHVMVAHAAVGTVRIREHHYHDGRSLVAYDGFPALRKGTDIHLLRN